MPAATTRHAWGRAISVAYLCVGLLLALIFAALGFPFYATLIVAILLLTFAVLRFILPGRPWFSSRNKVADVSVLATLGLLIAYFSQFTSIAAS